MSIPSSLSLLAMLVILLPACESFQLPQRVDKKSQPKNLELSWKEYDSKDHRKLDARIKLLKHEIRSCSSSAHCAELNYQIAILYLNCKPLILKNLNPAANHLNKSMKAGRYREHARVLNIVLQGWIDETHKKEKLRQTLERTRAIDLEFKQQ